MIKILVNAKEQQVPDSSAVLDVLKANGVVAVEMVTVQLNGEFLDASLFDNSLIKEGDSIDFLFFMGGGQI